MKPRFGLSVIFALAVSLLASSPALAAGETQTYLLELEVPNTAAAPNGDTVAITAEGQFSVFPNSVEAEGTFVHSDSGGSVLAKGTWEATALLNYQSYGCGVIFGTPIPPELPATLTVFCVIGDHVPGSAEEGVRLNVANIVNFNDVTGGDNVYIRIA